MDLLSMLGINRNDVLDFYKLLERGVEAMEALAQAQQDMLNAQERGK